jgi:hypothetical protein
MPPIALAATPPKVVPAYRNDQDMPPNQSVDGAETADKAKLVTPGVGNVASDDAAAVREAAKRDAVVSRAPGQETAGSQ